VFYRKKQHKKKKKWLRGDLLSKRREPAPSKKTALFGVRRKRLQYLGGGKMITNSKKLKRALHNAVNLQGSKPKKIRQKRKGKCGGQLSTTK